MISSNEIQRVTNSVKNGAIRKVFFCKKEIEA